MAVIAPYSRVARSTNRSMTTTASALTSTTERHRALREIRLLLGNLVGMVAVGGHTEPGLLYAPGG